MKKSIYIFFALMAMITNQIYAVNIYVTGESSDGLSSQFGYWRNGAFNDKGYSRNSLIAIENGDIYACYAKDYDYSRDIVYGYKNEQRLFSHIVEEEISDITSIAVLNGNLYAGVKLWKSGCYALITNGGLKERKGGCLVVDNGFLYYTVHTGYPQESTGYSVVGREYSINPFIKVKKMRVYDGDLYMIGDNYHAEIQINTDRRIKLFPGSTDYQTCMDYVRISGREYYILDNGDSDKRRIIDDLRYDLTILPYIYTPIAMETDGTLLYILAKKQQGAMTLFCVLTYDPATKSIISTQNLPGCANAWQIIVD